MSWETLDCPDFEGWLCFILVGLQFVSWGCDNTFPVQYDTKLFLIQWKLICWLLIPLPLKTFDLAYDCISLIQWCSISILTLLLLQPGEVLAWNESSWVAVCLSWKSSRYTFTIWKSSILASLWFHLVLKLSNHHASSPGHTLHLAYWQLCVAWTTLKLEHNSSK